MAQWEYCELVFNPKESTIIFFRTDNRSEGGRIKRDKAMGDDTDVDAFSRTFAQLGIDEWELVSASVQGQAIAYLFKRQLVRTSGRAHVQ